MRTLSVSFVAEIGIGLLYRRSMPFFSNSTDLPLFNHYDSQIFPIFTGK